MIEEFRKLNPEGLASRNGEKVAKPKWQVSSEARHRKEWGHMTLEQKEECKAVQRE